MRLLPMKRNRMSLHALGTQHRRHRQAHFFQHRPLQRLWRPRTCLRRTMYRHSMRQAWQPIQRPR